MLQHLQAERLRLMSDVAGLEQTNESLRGQLTKAKEHTAAQIQEREAVEGSDRNRVQTLEAQNNKLQAELEDCKREHDLKIVECESLRHDLKAAAQRLEASREIQAKLEMETHQQADELDIAKDKVAKLARAELAVEKYQKKLEEMVELKKQNKDLCERMDQYLDQIHSLESTNKSMANLSKMVEQYKNRAVELETEKFEALSSVQMRDQVVLQLKADIEKAKDARRHAQDECASYKLQLEQHLEMQSNAEMEMGAGSPSKRTGSADGSTLGALHDMYQTETVPILREKVKKLERELRMVTAGSESGSAERGEGITEELSALQQELEDTKKVKREREESLLATKKLLAETQYELSKEKVKNNL
jgi:chromosome segregation ATPase